MTSEQIKSASNEELQAQLITCDYKGKDVKTLAFNELIRRAYEAYERGEVISYHTIPTNDKETNT